ncbi:MAG: DNA repair and recombination protein RadA [Candidatus Freyarchaeota archaeon]|nr:DNA repair and recombination protein RadA [Candidatus Jordarchaeia archaeon]MBS7269254.1 DNA repair and recombination protein RadA [Candidatus Jordarchaeia archaeon]MBS7280122.1 DNA repair and recombination protein RadA [Candidatus Jordarchaeia archaeon]
MISLSGVLSLEDLPGIGPAISKKLSESGYRTPEAVAVATPKELAAAADIGESTAARIIEAAREKLNIGFISAEEYLGQRKSISQITTGTKNLDQLLGGGVETKGITELFGEFRTGKTQLCHQLAVTVQLPEELGGLEGEAIYIDTEGTFRPERLISIAERFTLEPKEVLKKVTFARAYNSDHQLYLSQSIEELIEKGKNIKLIIVDSIVGYFRAEYIGRGMLAERQQKLNKHLHTLLKLSELYNLAVIVTNQVMAKPDAFFGDPTSPVGGHIVAHNCTTRVYLRKSRGTQRIARLVDSPYLPEAEVVFSIEEDGVKDA